MTPSPLIRATGPILCRDCVFWTRHGDAKRWGDCSNDHFVGAYNRSPVAEPGSVIIDIAEGWGFYTDEEFGCIHYREKELP